MLRNFDDAMGDADAARVADPTALSKRAARRLIQRACVLTSRDRNVRQHIREADCLLLWVIEDWDLAWTIVLERGRMAYDRRPTKRPDLTMTWPTAEDFFRQAEAGTRKDDPPEHSGDERLWKFAQAVYSSFCSALREVLRNPVDENGTRLA